jgi:molybdopterin converting factor small subunit
MAKPAGLEKENDAVKIRLKSFFYFDVAKAFGHEQISLKAKKPTLRTLLQEVTQKSEGTLEIINPQSERVNDEYFILVNGSDFQTLPQGLETELSEGDEVGIGLLYFWGGG